MKVMQIICAGTSRLSVLGKMFDGSDELEVLREEESGPGKHQLVTLADGHVRHTGDV